MKQQKNKTYDKDFVIWHDGNEFYKISLENWEKVKHSVDFIDRKNYSKKMTKAEVEKYVN